MALSNVACAHFVAPTSVNEESFMSSNMTPEHGVVQRTLFAAATLGDEDGIELGPPEVTDQSILHGLGLVDRFGNELGSVRSQGFVAEQRESAHRVGLGSLGQSSASGFQTMRLGGIIDQYSTVAARSVFASIDDMPISRGMNDVARPLIGQSARGVPGIGAPPTVPLFDTSSAGVIGTMVPSRNVFASLPSPGGNDTYDDVAARAVAMGGGGRAGLIPNLVGGDYGSMFVTIPRVEYHELLQCKEQAERLLPVIAQLEQNCTLYSRDRMICKQQCAEICVRVKSECEERVKFIDHVNVQNRGHYYSRAIESSYYYQEI